MPFHITSIEASPEVPCINTHNTVIGPGTRVIWTPSPTPEGGPSGSLNPVTFLTPAAPTLTYQARITLKGTCSFPASCVGGGMRYMIKGWLGTTLVFQSKKFNVPILVPALLNANGFQMMAPAFNTAVCPLPFMWVGDFRWAVVWANGLGPIINATTTTRLELCWARSIAPNGPSSPSAGVRSRANLSPGYPIDLFRLFSPSPTEFATVLPRAMIP